MVVYSRKQSRSSIFEWQEKEKGWYLYTGEFPPGRKKKVKVVNLPVPIKMVSMSRTAKLKSAKKGDDSFETCSNIILYKGSLPPIGNIVVESSPSPSARTHSSRRSTTGRPKPLALKPSVDTPPSSKTHSSKRKTSLPAVFAIAERRSKYKKDTLATRPILLNEPEFEVDLKAISVYYPVNKEAPSVVGIPMEGFFDEADVMAEAMASASTATAQGAPAKTLAPPFEPVSTKENLSFDEGSKELFEDSKDEPIVKKRVSDFDEASDIMDMPKKSKAAAGIVPTTPTSVVPASLTLVGPGPSLTKLAPTSRFEIGSNYATIPNPVGEAISFFNHFEQAEANELDTVDFWSVGSLYVDFHGIRVSEDCVTSLEAVYRSREDFMQGFPFGRSAREHFLKLLGVCDE
ncbi:hypothetical protein SO802_015273 [Lithocarpus litseifolius]|uniref:Uncharacterized protein n=1 Tax=Lithocarpus litseifolius TaxID=425828 RepID=A0AAW2CT72_9ROSI